MQLKGELWAQACARQEHEAKETDASQRRSRLPPKPADKSAPYSPSLNTTANTVTLQNL